MSTVNFKRFCEVSSLRSIELKYLIDFLKPYAAFLKQRRVVLPSRTDSTDDWDYRALSDALMTPDTDTPNELIDALYFVNEMSTPEGMDGLLDALREAGKSPRGEGEMSPSDVAVFAWLKAPDLLERKHAEQYLTRGRSMVHFQTAESPLPKFKRPSKTILKQLETDLAEWFLEKNRGDSARVFLFDKGDIASFLVRHGDPLRREGAINRNESSSVTYRPEKHDLITYDKRIGELGVRASSKGEQQLYRINFGKHCFGKESFFPNEDKYTLEPLRDYGEDSLACADVKGIDWVRLKEVQVYWGGEYSEIEIRKANDLFKAYSSRDKLLPSKGRINRATFSVKFSDSKSPRSVTIKPPNAALYLRDDDAVHLEEWLHKRGFSKNGVSK
ncbi:MAG: hypothetical protein CMJ46_13670 [Planctomyces sp.]|nr:hypothetical protein [Planctomyces sp.]